MKATLFALFVGLLMVGCEKAQQSPNSQEIERLNAETEKIKAETELLKAKSNNIEKSNPTNFTTPRLNSKSETPKRLTSVEVNDILNGMNLKRPGMHERMRALRYGGLAGIDPRFKFGNITSEDRLLNKKQTQRMLWAYNGDFDRLLRE